MARTAPAEICPSDRAAIFINASPLFCSQRGVIMPKAVTFFTAHAQLHLVLLLHYSHHLNISFTFSTIPITTIN
jgi:hypothetical protein